MGSKGCDGYDGSADVDGHLGYVGPDDGGHASLEGVEQREEGDDSDGEGVVGADGDADDDGDSEDADALSSGAGEQEEAGGDLMQRGSETAGNRLVGGEHLSLKVPRQEDQRDDDAANHVAEDDLQEAEVSCIGDAGDGDDGEGRGLRSEERR